MGSKDPGYHWERMGPDRFIRSWSLVIDLLKWLDFTAYILRAC